IAGHELELTCPFLPQGIEEGPDRLLVATLGRPDHPAGQVVTDHGQVLVTLLVLDLVDGDGDQTVEQVDPPQRLSGHPDAHVVDRPPGDPVTPCSRQLVRHDGVEDHQVLEGPGEGTVVSGEGDLCHRHPVGGTADTGGLGYEITSSHAHVDVAPPTRPATIVEPRGDDPALATAPPDPGPAPHPHHQLGASPVAGLLQLPPHDHHRGHTQTQQTSQYAVVAHAVLLLQFLASRTRNRRNEAACRRGWVGSAVVRHPRQRHKTQNAQGWETPVSHTPNAKDATASTASAVAAPAG